MAKAPADGMTGQDWRREKREEIRAQFGLMSLAETEDFVSPSGKYRLSVGTYANRPEHWSYSAGNVAHTKGSPIARVERNYGAFPFLWVEQHANGHDYLVCGEDYQGQTIIELDTGRRVDHLSDKAEQGAAFCWAQHYVSPDGRFLGVDGCFWACPYEMVIFDFSAPMSLPFRELYRSECHAVLNGGFRDDGSITWTSTQTVRKSDRALLDDLSIEELSGLRREDGSFNHDLLADVALTTTWHPERAVVVERS